MTEQCGDVPDAADEYNRDERIETIYQGWGAREMAERIVDLEDELGADVDGLCTGMHADVAEAHAEIERLRALVGYFEFRAAEDATRARRKIESVERASDEVTRAYNAALSDLEMQGKALKDARADSEYFEGWATANGKRLNATLAQRDEYRDALSEVATYDEWEISAVGQPDPVRFVITDVRPNADAERDRYRLAWLSARCRAADEANLGMEALDLKAAEIARLRAELADLREAIHEES